MTDILLAAHNGEKYIREQLQSLLSQTVKDIRIIIRDDDSVDSTREIIREIMAETGAGSSGAGQKICLVPDNCASGSAKNNFMKLIQIADSDYVMFCDQDDIWERDKIEKSLKLIKKMEEKAGKDIPLMVHTDLYVLAQNGDIISDSLIDYMKLPRKENIKNLLLQNSVTGCTITINRALLMLLKRAKDTDKIVMHDHFTACVAALFGHIGLIREPLIRYRQHGDNEVGARDAKSMAYMLKRFLRGRKSFQKEMENNYIQAGYIISLYPEELGKADEAKRRLIEGYADLRFKTSREKRRFFRKYNMYKYGRLKKLMQIIWC